MIYLIYETKEAATDRADKQGKDNNLSYWVDGMGTRWLTEPTPTADGKWVLDASDYDLDDVEELALVDSYLAVEKEGGPE
jgi:hypothetical protein